MKRKILEPPLKSKHEVSETPVWMEFPFANKFSRSIPTKVLEDRKRSGARKRGYSTKSAPELEPTTPKRMISIEEFVQNLRDIRDRVKTEESTGEDPGPFWLDMINVVKK